MGARVLYRDSQGRDGSVVLDPSSPCYVGRALDCAIRTDDAMVSRKHSMIRMDNGRFYVEDLGSSNGTHVNDVRVTKHFLSHNDVVRCGSLWLRYVEDGPIPIAGPGMQVGVPPTASGPKRGATRRLDAAPSPVPMGGPVAQPMGQPNAINPPPYPGIGHAATIAPPSYPPPASHAQPALGPAPFGGPPPMPAHGELIGPDRADGLSPVGVREDSVVVDFGVDPAEHDRLREDIEQSRQRIEELQNAYDREAADGKRLRAEGQTLRDRIEELRKAIQDRQEAVEAQERIADELRNETRQARDDLAAVRVQIGEMTENLAARDRHIARTHEDIGKLKDDIEELEKQLADVSRTKDEGWRKLNEQLSEIDNLREVVNEQERMLEERRVGLVSQEEMINQLRREKEAMLKEKAQLKAERDELRADSGRSSAQISAIDEENKRLAKMLAEIQGRAVSGHPVDASDHAARAAEEIKSLRVELRTVESDRDRLQEMYERAETEVDRLQQAVARLEVESRDWHDKSNRAASNKSVADEALGKAEAARHKAQEEAIAAARQRDEAVTGADQARRELDRARRRIDELESSRGDPTASGGGGMDGARARVEQQLIDAQVRISELEEALSALRRQARSFVLPDGEEATAVVAAAGPDKLGERALTVHDSINDVLSELRSNILLIQGEFADLAKEHSGHSARIIRETIEALVGNAEDAKGALRSLRELVEFDA